MSLALLGCEYIQSEKYWSPEGSSGRFSRVTLPLAAPRCPPTGRISCYSNITTSALIANIVTINPRGGKTYTPLRVQLTTSSPPLTLENDPMGWHTLQITSWLLLALCFNLPHAETLPVHYDLLSWILQRSVPRGTTASSPIAPTTRHARML